ncbi:MAG: LacI family DNA-binding transcriptional regulator [Chloroflexota bacterium]
MATATIKDVAKKAGVGVGTVSRVINGSPAVSDVTRHKVISVIEALDYTPNANARRLSLGKTMTIAVIVPFFTRPSVVERLRGLEKTLAQSEYDLILYNVETIHRRHDCFRNVPRRERIDGMIIISLMPTNEEADRLKQTGVPIVLVDTHHPQFSYVMIDDVDGGYKATKYLIELGHRKIAHIGDFIDNPFNFQQISDRYQGYRQALQEANIPFRADYHQEGKHSRLEARRLARRLLALADPPTAVFTFSDTQAIGILEAAQELGLRVPEELSVIGYDDIEIAEYLHLTTIRQSLFQSGVEGGQILLDAMATNTQHPQEIVLPTELVVRRTTAPPLTA